MFLSVVIDVACKKRIAQRGKNEKRMGGGVMPKLKPSDLQIRRAVVRAELRKNMELEMLRDRDDPSGRTVEDGQGAAPDR